MKIVLLKDVMGKDKDGNKFIRTTVGIAYEWRKGQEMEVSEATGQKMIKAGDAEVVKVKDVKAKDVAASK